MSDDLMQIITNIIDENSLIIRVMEGKLLMLLAHQLAYLVMVLVPNFDISFYGAFLSLSQWINELLCLPINLFYAYSIRNEWDVNSRWLQAVAFAAPGVTALFIVAGSIAILHINAWLIKSPTVTYFPDIFWGLLVMYPHIYQLVPSIFFAVQVLYDAV